MTPFLANESARISIITWVIILNIYVGFVIVISPNSKAFLKPFPTLSSCFPLALGLLHPALDSQKPETICSHSFPIVPLPSLHFSRPITFLAPKFDGNACYIMFGKWGYSLDAVASTFPIIVSVRGICIWHSDLAPTLHPWSPINWFDWKWQSGSKSYLYSCQQGFLLQK